ncbi:hypothetical protein B0T16DRAFT_460724 [Cercophora newfieldiana]|uniref:Uncharacterized protein n=1 Tax=Cercophora newfieldiana TaxID=92897 RepID=A0AA40CIW6_9PEZI|nr:hypothetical protein B0T16DRAFT_460724 [Cercophora newfieldiana]
MPISHHLIPFNFGLAYLDSLKFPFVPAKGVKLPLSLPFQVFTMKKNTAFLFLATLLHLSEGQTKPKLLPWAFEPLPLGSVKPLGWLQGELRIMADGLAGHELDFYPYVKDSPWLNGTAEYTRLGEAVPYWFNGLVPLAYSLDDQRLKDQVHSVVSRVLEMQYEDGWIGPENATNPDRNLWGRIPFLLGMIQLAEANPTGWHEKLVLSITRHMREAHRILKTGGSGYSNCGADVSFIDCSWGQIRMHDMVIVIQWLLENAKLEDNDVTMLWEVMHLLYELSKWKWETWYTEDQYEKVVSDAYPSNPMFPYNHRLKASAVIRRFTHKEDLVEATNKAVEWTFRYHGSPSGSILADESQRDLAPFMGSELCATVETGYSLAYLYQALGTNGFADRAETVIYNALPVMLTHDAWGHQYLSRPNQPFAQRLVDRASHFTTNGGAATVYSLEPQYPCCTVNHPQGYPKFVANSWVRAEKGLAHVLLGPSLVTTSIPGAGQVSIKCETNYPFSDTLFYTVSSDTAFNLFLRVPTWATLSKSAITVTTSQGGSIINSSAPISPDPLSGLHRVSLPAGKSTVNYTIGSSIRVETRDSGAVSVYVGNLLYALDVGEEVTTSLPHRWYDNDPNSEGTREFSQVPNIKDTYFNNTKPWNVAIDPATLEYHPGNASSGHQMGRGFAPEVGKGADNFVSVRGCEIKWDTLSGGVAPAPPPKGEKCQGDGRTYRLIPYGLAKVHMSELPTLKL